MLIKRGSRIPARGNASVRPLQANSSARRRGMGQVFEAMDVGDCGPVAIKVIKGREAMSEAARIRFVREARAAGLLQHPNIVAVRDIGQVRGALYIVMEYLGGLPLTTFIPAPPSLTLNAKLSLLAQTADALGPAHSQGVAHRDLTHATITVPGV